MSQSRKCNSCGAEVALVHKFCIKCGAPQEKLNLCTRCNADLPVNAKFCVRCGFKVKESDLEQNDEEDKPDEEKETDEDLEKVLDELYTIVIPNQTQIDEFMESFERIRKAEYDFDVDKKLQVLLNGASTIVENYHSRPYLIRAIQSYNEAYILATNQGRDDLANQIRYVLSTLNIKFGDLIPNPSNRIKYYREAMNLVKELEREVKEGDIVGEDTVRVYLLRAEILQRNSDLKNALAAVNLAQKLTEEYLHLREEVLILKTYLLIDSARYTEALDLIESISEEEADYPHLINLLKSEILIISAPEESDIELLGQLSSDTRLETQDRIKVKLELTNYLLALDTDRALVTFQSIYEEELDPQQTEIMKNLEETLKDHIKRSKVSRTILVGNAEEEARNRSRAISDAQGKQNWEAVVFNSRRLIELLDDYQSEIDPNFEKTAEANFKLANALFSLTEYEQAQAHFDIAIGYYKDGVGDPIQLPTAYRHLTDTLVQLRQYQEAYDTALKGKERAVGISHPALVREFDNRLQQLNPERIKKLQEFNRIMSFMISEMGDIANFRQLFRILRMDQNFAGEASKFFYPISLGLLRSDIKKSIFFMREIEALRNTAFTVINKPSLKPLVTRPLSILSQIPKFGPFTNMFREITGGDIKTEVLAVMLVDSVFDFVLNVRFRDKSNISLDLLIKTVMENMITLRDEILVVMLLGGIIKSVETRVSI